jgi:diguanylate cyclase (GGDEF)-like protein
MDWFAGIVAQCVILGLIGWYLARRSETAILNALKVHTSAQANGLKSAQVGDPLPTPGKIVSDHSEKPVSFEQSPQDADDSQNGVSLLNATRQASLFADQDVDTTIAGLVAACDGLLDEERSSPDACQETTDESDATDENTNHAELLVHIASTLLEMNRELRVEFNVVQNEVAASKDQIIQLLTRASSAEQMARIDTLTELPNRRALDEAFSHFEEILGQTGQPFSMILLDIDHFKEVNDSYGHDAGDALLVLIARSLRENSKTADFVCRVGGEEFVVLLPRCSERPATAVAERYRQAIEVESMQYGDEDISITVSCGVAQAIPGKTQANLLKRADTALYSAKSRGRNQTCVDSDFIESDELFKRR